MQVSAPAGQQDIPNQPFGTFWGVDLQKADSAFESMYRNIRLVARGKKKKKKSIRIYL